MSSKSVEKVICCETRDKEGIESKRERERHTKRFKALNDWDIIKDTPLFCFCAVLDARIEQHKNGDEEGSLR